MAHPFPGLARDARPHNAFEETTLFATPAFAQAAGGAASADPTGGLLSMAPFFVVMIALMYFMMIRPQQQQAKRHKAMLENMKRNDTVVLNSGLIGKLTRIEDKEVMVEVATGVNVRVVKTMISEVRAKGEPAPANDPKAA